MTSKYRVRWVNFGHYSQEEFDKLGDAISYVNSKGFEAAVELDGKIVASKTTFSGWSGLYDKLTPRTYSELRRGDVVLHDNKFRKIKEFLRSNRKEVEVEFEDGEGAVFQGLVFTKG